MNPALINLAIQETPLMIELLKALFKKANPAAPTPTDAEVISAWQNGFISSLAKDDAWLSAHPEA
jgi:hypothetical protein